MPYSNNKSRKSRYPRRRRSRLADKRINTLVEKRMEDIAKKEVRKKLQYFVEARCFPANVASPTDTGVSIHQLHSDISPISQTGLTTSQNSVDYWPISNWNALYQSNNPSSSVGLPATYSQNNLEFNVKQVQAFLSFYNENPEPYQVCCALIGIPNANVQTANFSNSGSGETNRLRPTRSMLTQNNWRFAKTDSGIFSGQFMNADEGQFVTQHHILDRKTVVLPGGGKSDTFGDANPKRVVHVKLNKVYKNAKKLIGSKPSGDTQDVDEPESLLDNYNIYLAVSTNCANASSLIGMQMIAGCKFSLGSNTVPILRHTDPE